MVFRLNTETLTDQTTTPKHSPNPKTIEMINPRDLRLGNLVEHEVFGVVEVVAIYKHAIDVSKDGKTKEWFAGSIEKPIPLTEEWLIRFGFETIKGWLDVWRKDGFDRFDLTSIGDGVYFNDTQIEFVHQLQNAFFVIEQTELTLSNP
jgi:hypothetical protein